MKRLFFPVRDGIEVAGHAGSVEEAIVSARSEDFDMIILDLWLENKLPIQNVRLLKIHFPGKPILVYTSETSIVWKKRMLEEQVMSYIVKSATRAEIKTAIETVAAGTIYYPVDLGELNPQRVRFTFGSGVSSITPFEREILRMLSQGYSRLEISDILKKSPSYLDKLLKVLRDRFNVKNNLELLTVIDKPETPY